MTAPRQALEPLNVADVLRLVAEENEAYAEFKRLRTAIGEADWTEPEYAELEPVYLAAVRTHHALMKQRRALDPAALRAQAEAAVGA